MQSMYATKYTLVAASSSDEPIESDGPIYITGMLVSSTSSLGTATLKDKDNNTIHVIQAHIDTATAGEDITLAIDIPWYAHSGLRVSTDAEVTVTVFHSNRGA